MSLNFDSKLIDFINSTRGISRISDILRYCLSYGSGGSSYFKLTGDYIKVESYDTLSYIPKSKLLSTSSFDDTKNRTPIKVGRFINKFLKSDIIKGFGIVDSEIENFVNLFKSYFDTNLSKFEIVSGENIRKLYLENNYYTQNGCQSGSLWNSCMRQSDRNKFLDLYCKNDIKMLVHFDKNGKVRTRALLWDSVVDSKGISYKIMDRIYFFYEHEVTAFKKWASENDYYSKYEQSAKQDRLFISPSNELVDLQLKVKLDTWNLNSYPYLDTFKYFNPNEGIISNSNAFYYTYTLVQTNGMLYREDIPNEDLVEEEPLDDW